MLYIYGTKRYATKKELGSYYIIIPPQDRYQYLSYYDLNSRFLFERNLYKKVYSMTAYLFFVHLVLEIFFF